MTNTDPVFSIQQGDYLAPIGATSDNIYITTANGSIICSLTEFFEEWQAFKENARFLQYGTTTPSSSRVKLWYQTEVDSEEDDIDVIPEEDKIANMIVWARDKFDNSWIKIQDLHEQQFNDVAIDTYLGDIDFKVTFENSNGDTLQYENFVDWILNNGNDEDEKVSLIKNGNFSKIKAKGKGNGLVLVRCSFIGNYKYLIDRLKESLGIYDEYLIQVSNNAEYDDPDIEKLSGFTSSGGTNGNVAYWNYSLNNINELNFVPDQIYAIHFSHGFVQKNFYILFSVSDSYTLLKENNDTIYIQWVWNNSANPTIRFTISGTQIPSSDLITYIKPVEIIE